MKTSMLHLPVILLTLLLGTLFGSGSARGAGCPAPLYRLGGTFDTGTDSVAVAVGDFNGDGKLDLVVANQSSTNVSVLLGLSNGTFAAASNYPTGLIPTNVAYPTSVAVADFNGDGKADLVVANNFSTGSVSVLLGVGNGTFLPATNYATGPAPAFVAVGYFNGDTNVDLVTANYNDPGTVSVLLGNGDGTFQAPVDYAAGRNPSSVAVGDFNGDGKSDLAVANDVSTSASVKVLLGNGDGTFQTAVSYATSRFSVSVAIGDFNGDGKSDLVVANNRSPSASVSVLVGNGDTNGTFQPAINYPTGPFPTSVAVGDFNGDTLLDVAVIDDYGLSVLSGQGDGTFAAPASYGTGYGANSLAVGDFNRDGQPDFAVANYNTNGSVSLMLLTTEPGIVRSNSTTAIVSWPYPSTGFVLEATMSLSTPNWQSVPQVPVSNNCLWQAALPLDTAQRHFRLRKPIVQ